MQNVKPETNAAELAEALEALKQESAGSIDNLREEVEDVREDVEELREELDEMREGAARNDDRSDDLEKIHEAIQVEALEREDQCGTLRELLEDLEEKQKEDKAEFMERATALYELSTEDFCKCQELETLIDAAEKRAEELAERVQVLEKILATLLGAGSLMGLKLAQ